MHGWRPALVAADAVVGDHGSVTLYGAALDKPTVLAAFGSDAVPGTAGAALAETAPRLDPYRSPYEQVEEAVRTHVPGRYAPIADRAFAVPGGRWPAPYGRVPAAGTARTRCRAAARALPRSAVPGRRRHLVDGGHHRVVGGRAGGRHGAAPPGRRP
ncbi:hypothetical protein NKH77_06210 [Streptomyces sp. M19]